MIQPVKGTRDFYPTEMAYRRWLYEQIRTVSEAFGYQEFEAPFLERLELYAAKSGQELVKEQSFVFPDRGGDMIALRPELTPSLARMVATRSQSLGRPLRWWSFGPFWRYERPQRGRTREFFQWNIDLLGIESAQADAEIASVAASFFRSVGLSPEVVRIKINNRALAETLLANLGIASEKYPEVFRLIDRQDRMKSEEWADYGKSIGLDEGRLSELKVLLNDRDSWRQSKDLVDFFEAAELMGATEYLEYDPNVIRGLDYYTGTVFEAWDTSGKFRSIFGGGRYDSLVSDVGGEPIAATGFAMGDVVFSLVLEEYGVRPAIRANPAEVLVTTFNAETRDDALRLCAELRAAGVQTEWYPDETARLSKQLKYADRQGMPFAIIMGPEEIESGQLTLKDLLTGEQETMARSEVIERIRSSQDE